MNTKKVTLYVDPIVNTTFSIIIWDPIIEFFLIISNSLKNGEITFCRPMVCLKNTLPTRGLKIGILRTWG